MVLLQTYTYLPGPILFFFGRSRYILNPIEQPSQNLKQFAIILLGASLLTLSLKEWVVVSSFLINRSAIAEYLCVEKNNPASCCRGSCFLKSSLQDVNDEEQQPIVLEREMSYQYVPSDLLATVFVDDRAISSPQFLYSALKTQLYIKDVPKPPWR